MEVLFQHPATADIRAVKIGWSWQLFFLSSFLGLPLFFRGLHTWGGGDGLSLGAKSATG